MVKKQMGRREFLRFAGLGAAAAVVAACQPEVVVETVVKEVEKVVKETVIVDGEERVVERIITVMPEAPASVVTAPGSFPIVEDRVTLSIIAAGKRDFNENSWTQWLEEQTNIDIVYDMALEPDSQVKLNTMVTAGDLPDVIAFFYLELPDQQVLADQGVVIPLNDLIEQYGFESKMILNRHPEIREQLTLADGQFYSLWGYATVLHVSLAHKAWIYGPWLDTLGLDMPTTTEEYREVLRAFKTGDPNGSGTADEVPLSGGTHSWAEPDRFFMNSFVHSSRMGSVNLMVEDGIIKASYVDPGRREGLKYMNSLFDEGLLDPQMFTQDREQLTALAENETPLLGSVQMLWYGQFTRWGGESTRWSEYRPIPPLEGPTGLRQTPWNPYQPLGTGSWLITKECEHPEIPFRLADFMYSWEACMRNTWGVKDLDWREGQPGEVAINGGPARFVMLRPWATDPDTFMNVNVDYQPPEFRYGQIELEGDLETDLYRISQNVYAPYGVQDKILPPLAFTAEQANELGELDTVVNSYQDQSFAEFVTGGLDPEQDWETYLERLDGLGLQRYLEIYQEAYDAKMGA
ncbi:MAG: twin-arginine translocation signal domain-containing protein [Anaerolineae bacterium]|jgi:putative aldouronate transport system substrate-binding protein